MRSIPQKILSIGNDQISGSSKICLKLASTLKAEIKLIDNSQKIKRFLKHIEYYILLTYPDMSILVAFFKSLKFSSKKSLLNSIDEFVGLIKNAPKIISSKLKPNFKRIKSLITFSASSVVEKVMKKLKKEGFLFEILVCESRPFCEGKKLAKRLAMAHISTTITTDVIAFSNVSKVDAIFIGADMLGSNFFRNKVGTKALLELGKIHQVESFVLCEKFKNYQKKSKTYSNLEKKYKYQNQYLKSFESSFENIPLSLVKNIITD
jgi:translation initiation factor 2B subunit (eIF-2B alpha/beta/delta family)